MRHFEPVKPTRGFMRRLRPRPFLLEQIWVPRWFLWLIIVLWIQSGLDQPNRVLAAVFYGIAIVAIGQWLWWGRRP